MSIVHNAVYSAHSAVFFNFSEQTARIICALHLRSSRQSLRAVGEEESDQMEYETAAG